MAVELHQNIENSARIEVSESALNYLLKCLQQTDDNIGIRLSVKKTGCSGLSYVLDYVSKPEKDDVICPLAGKYHIYIERKSYPFLKGIKMDYVKQGLNTKMVYHNPNQTGQCGCGESFTVE